MTFSLDNSDRSFMELTCAKVVASYPTTDSEATEEILDVLGILDSTRAVYRAHGYAGPPPRTATLPVRTGAPGLPGYTGPDPDEGI